MLCTHEYSQIKSLKEVGRECVCPYKCVFVCVCMRESERDREREGEVERKRKRE
jgi:hypothetical protein